MKLFDYETYQDCVTEQFLQILPYRKYALLDFTLQLDNYSNRTKFPLINFSIGDMTLCGLSIHYRQFYFSCDIIGVRRNLEWYRENK